jgi:drug/metabolite transporter (DMT)-like permease
VNWLLLSLGTAFLTALAALLNKQALKYWSEPLLILTSSAILAVVLFSISGGCELSDKFFLYLPASIAIHITASILNMKALKSGDLSAVFPLINLTPLFMFITSPLISGEFPRLITIPGILLIVVGAYLLNLKRGEQDFFGPVKALWFSKAARYMTGVAFLWSLAGNFDKLGMLQSSPAIWGASVKTGVALYMIPACMLRSRKNRINNVPKAEKRSLKMYAFLLIIPLVMSLNVLCNMEAYRWTLAINVVSVKRLCSLFSVLLAWWILGEKNIGQRMFAAVIMVAGVLWVGFMP